MFSGGIEVNQFAQIPSIFEQTFGDDTQRVSTAFCKNLRWAGGFMTKTPRSTKLSVTFMFLDLYMKWGTFFFLLKVYYAISD